MDSVEQLALKHSVSTKEAREIWRKNRAQGVHERFIKSLAAEHGVSLAEAEEIHQKRIEQNQQEKERRDQRFLGAIRRHGSEQGLTDLEVYTWLEEERLEYRRSGNKPSSDFIRIWGEQYGQGVRESWKTLQITREYHQEFDRRRQGKKSKYQRRKAKGLSISDSLRKLVLSEEAKICNYCNESDAKLEIDHIYPALGTNRENLTLACQSCNKSKSDLDPIKWAKTQGPSFLKRARALIEARGLKFDRSDTD